MVAATGQRQVPWASSSLIGDFYFVPARGITVAKKASVPRRAEGASHRVHRGGSDNGRVERCPSAFRDTEDPGRRRHTIGFRLAMDPS